MTYRNEIRPWAVFRCLDAVNNICEARFRKRSDADAYTIILRRITPNGIFRVTFDQVEEVTPGY